MLNEHHAQFVMLEHRRRLRDASEMARLLHEASKVAPRRRRWALLRQRATAARPQPQPVAAPQPSATPAYSRLAAPRRAVP